MQTEEKATASSPQARENARREAQAHPHHQIHVA
jgi:hypothetical protein